MNTTPERNETAEGGSSPTTCSRRDWPLEILRAWICVVIVLCLGMSCFGVTLLAMDAQYTKAEMLSPMIAIRAWAAARAWRFYWERFYSENSRTY